VTEEGKRIDARLPSQLSASKSVSVCNIHL